MKIFITTIFISLFGLNHLNAQTTFGTDTQTACDTFTWIDGMTYTSSTNTETHTLVNANSVGADSIVTLDLTINNSTFGTDVQSVCTDYTWIDGNIYTTSNNTAMFVLANANSVGCDSTVTLDLTINTSNTGIDVQTACDTYTWIDGVEYTASNNTATHTLTNVVGCDSIVTLDLTINNSTFGTDVQSACTDYTWIDGNIYTTSNNTAMFVLANANSVGCDSTVTLDLSINSSTGTDVRSACDTYTWIDGVVYTESNNTATFVLLNALGCDSLITLDLSINNSIVTDIQTACDTYTWINGVIYTTSNNTAMHTLTNMFGCDSIITLDLTINNSNTGTDVQVACDSYTWIDDIEYTSSNNTATFVVQNAAGCDSTVTLDLIINNSSTGTDVQVACNSYEWIDGITYTVSNNVATFVLLNAVGCDSTVTLDLTVNSTTGTDVQAVCSKYVWIDGIEYTSSNNTAIFVLANANSVGCDSIVTLDLTILNNTTGTDVQSECATFTWIDGNTYTESNNTATFVLPNAKGCDSTVTLDLTINGTTGTDIQTTCDTYTWIDGVVYTSSNNTATFVLPNAVGCDSTVTLNLTINNSTFITNVETVCDTYTWVNGVVYTSSTSPTNLPTYVLLNSVGCLSTLELDLTINNSTTGTDVQTACNSYTWIDGNVYTESNNTAMFTLMNAVGCDSVVTLDLTINTVNINTAINTTLNVIAIESDASGAVYQWLDCNDAMSVLVGEENQTFTVTSNGNYAVEVSENGCVDTSNCVMIDNIGVDENTFNDKFSIYPNPTIGNFSIEFSQIQESLTIQLFSITGEMIQSNNYKNENLIELELNQPVGIYFVEVIDAAGKKAMLKIVKM